MPRYDASVATYRQTVLSGFQQVEDEIATLRILEQQSVVEDEAVKAAREAEALTLNQYKAGTVPYSSVITAQTTRFSAEETALTVLSSRLQASVALIEALGGGWNSGRVALGGRAGRIIQLHERRRDVPAQHCIARIPLLFGREFFEELNFARRIRGHGQSVQVQQPIAGQRRQSCSGRDDAEQIERIGAGERHVLPGTACDAPRAAARTASGVAYCSPENPATKRPPRISPRASSRRQQLRMSRHGGSQLASRASSFQKMTPQRRSSVRTTCSTASSSRSGRCGALERRTSAQRPASAMRKQRQAPLAPPGP